MLIPFGAPPSVSMQVAPYSSTMQVTPYSSTTDVSRAHQPHTIPSSTGTGSTGVGETTAAWASTNSTYSSNSTNRPSNTEVSRVATTTTG